MSNVVVTGSQWDLRGEDEGGCGVAGCDPRLTRVSLINIDSCKFSAGRRPSFPPHSLLIAQLIVFHAPSETDSMMMKRFNSFLNIPEGPMSRTGAMGYCGDHTNMPTIIIDGNCLPLPQERVELSLHLEGTWNECTWN